MSKSFDCTVESAVSVQQIQAAFSERGYWLARLEPHSGTAELRSFDVDAQGEVRVTVAQDLRNTVLPGLFGKLYPGGVELVQSETWTVDRGDKVRGLIHVQAHGAPGSGRGTIEMTPTRDGKRLECSGIVKVKIPIVGGKIESYFGRQMMDQIPEILRFIAQWTRERA
ncbi:hypothetical protein AU192_16465 [Mycobacterium lehmannii]|uniref:DUF2505 domain-containing protein n=1 Tax=Mycobacterium lehmannii TaxID=2048550 RepID=A0A117JLV0_9MYCO|nr:DUF2505 domain-containing protein [Mycobacterium lehmannii]KUI20495.1 hypothetical protein AU192_16465 [Mycobacterium lehmannii]